MPFYPLTPALFCLTCAYLLYSSLVYTGLGALVGVGVLILRIAASADRPSTLVAGRRIALVPRGHNGRMTEGM